MTSTDRILGQLAAINTFIENFPMSILDMMHGKVYTSVFEFLIDVLNACGVDTNEIIEFLLSKIYGIEESINGGIEGFYEKIKNGEIIVEEQNEFLEALETGIKGVLMGLLSSVFTCSAIPILPNKVFDAPNPDSFNGKQNSSAFNCLTKDLFEPILIPKSAIDPMGILDINPNSEAGRLFYSTNSKDVYYRKVFKPIESAHTVTKTATVSKENTVTKVVSVEENLYDNNYEISLVSTAATDSTSENENKFKLSNSVNVDLTIIVSYSPYNSKSRITWESTIPAGETETKDLWLISPVDMYGQGQRTIIHSISINNNGSGVDAGNKTWVYLSKNGWDGWTDNGIDSISWGDINLSTKTVEKLETITGITTSTYTYEEEEPITIFRMGYEVCDYEDVDENTLVRVDYVEEGEVDLDAPEFIVHYESTNPNTLYRTGDMNAFIWYVLHKGMKTPQVEYNHMMWDSRVSASKNGISRNLDIEWNNWYNSKNTFNGEFKFHDSTVTDNSPIYPIIQLEPQGMSENLLRIHIPSQTYWLPKIREGNLGFNDKTPKRAFNASVYKFNWDYLNNIQIIKPKLLLVGLCESLLGFALHTASSVNVNMTKKLIEAKLSSAVKKVIEANDMEIEDCYTTFSNDEVEMMMEEMLLSRYNATTYGGETSTVRVHDTQHYIDILDKVNSTSTMGGNMTQIKKLVTEVTSDPGTEGSIDYGLQVSTDGNLLKKLLWAIIMPIVMSIFTPQVLLLIYLNFSLMGIVRIDETLGNDLGIILNLLMNKIFALVKSIIIFIKDLIIQILMEFLYKALIPLLLKFLAILLREKIIDWLLILKAALECLPLLKFQSRKIIGQIEDVNYADIINTQDTPTSSNNC